MIKLDVATEGGWHHFTVGFSTEAQAVKYIQDHISTHIVSEIEDEPVDLSLYPALNDALYPQCHHHMSASMCMDPYGENHFGTREQELQQGW
jgi:hypothetical protein